MRRAQYVRLEKAIVAADAGSIRSRWFWGLRLLRDVERMSSEKSLKHGVTEQLIADARAAGLNLSSAEIRRRLQCARTYQTEAEIARAVGDFESWRDLSAANFPAYEVDPDEPLADHRTEEEKRQEAKRRLLDRVGEQGALFPLDQFEPDESTLKDLLEYTEQQEELTARFVAHGEKRRRYVDQLVEVAEGDLSLTWAEAEARLPEVDGEAVS